MHPRFLVALLTLVAAACDDSPIAPSRDAQPLPAPSTSAALSISSFTVTGQFVDGRYRYWPELTMTAGRGAVTVGEVEFLPLGTTLPQRMVMSRQIAGGQAYTFSPEFATSVAAEHISVTVRFVDDRGESGQLAAVTAAPRLSTDRSSALEIVSFTVSGFMEGRWHAY